MEKGETMRLGGELSSYLDCLRFLAATAVLFAHMQQDGLYMEWLPLARFSHEAVIVFFVMSGLIICSTTFASHRDLRTYAIARLSRVYSVALPAVVFCLLMTAFVPAGVLKPGELTNYHPVTAWSVVSSLLFLNESWLNPADLTLNGPYWSLCYEVWYYVAFGAFMFLEGKKRWIVLAGTCLIMGPSVLALFPIWLAGAWVASGRRFGSDSWSTGKATWIFIASFVVILAINWSGIDATLKRAFHDHVTGFWRLESSQRLVTDYLVGLAILANLLAFGRLRPGFRRFFGRTVGVFKYLAGFSFTLYLFHRPMTQLLGYYFPNTDKSIPYSIALGFGILATCLLISYGTERQLKFWRDRLARLLPGASPEARRLG